MKAGYHRNHSQKTFLKVQMWKSQRQGGHAAVKGTCLKLGVRGVTYTGKFCCIFK